MDASDTIYTKDEKYKMKSLKGHFAKTNILMIVISAALVITMSFILIFVFSLSNPDGFKTLFGTAKEVFSGSLERSQRYLYYFIIWAVLTGFTVLVTCLALSTNLARTVLTPIHRLKEAAENIAEGELDFDVLTSGDAEELAELCNSIERIRKKLKENAEHEHFQKEERNMLVANLSHDMRTPVTAIKGYIEGINDGIADTPEKQKQYLDTIYNKALVLEKLLDGMTEYSELELGRMQYVFEFVDITEYLRNVAEEYSAEIETKGFVFESSLLEHSLTVVADRDKLKRVLDNLIGNAVKYNRKGGSISLTQETDGRGVLISVTDTGVGIQREDLNRVFDGFYRGDSARSNIKGNGLGLAIAKQIVESHRGKIWVKSEKNKGTQVFVYLPLREE